MDTSTHRVGTTTVVVLGVVLGLAAGTGISLLRSNPIAPPTERPASVPAIVSGFSTSPFQRLEEAHEEVLAVGGQLVAAKVNDVGIDGESTSARLTIQEVLWSTDALPAMDGVIDVAAAAAPHEVVQLEDLTGSDVLALVTSRGRLLRVAPVTGGDALTGPNSDRLFSLAAAAEWMVQTSHIPANAIDWCGEQLAPPQDRSPVQALVDYFELSGSQTATSRFTATGQQQQLAESMALDAGSIKDPVTGLWVHASANHIAQQLSGGTPSDQVTVRWTVPVLVTFFDEPLQGKVVVFHDSNDGSWLGWIHALPEVQVSEDDGSETVIPTSMVYITPPAPGHDLAVVIRDRSRLLGQCPLSPIEQPLVVPFDAVAGSGRARLDLPSSGYEQVTAEDFAAVRKGEYRVAADEG